MGNMAGWVDMTFDAYTIPDQWYVIQNGVKKFWSSQKLSGKYTKRIHYDPEDGAFYDITVYGNSDPATGWTLTISCPD
jgi:hypothetical protein